MTARKMTLTSKMPRTPRLHLDKTGATVLAPKVRKVTVAMTAAEARAAKKTTGSALRGDKLSLRVVVVTKAQRVRDAFAAGMSLTESAKATGADPAYVWDLAKIWEEKTGTRVPRSGHTPKVVVEKVAKAPPVKTTPAQNRKAAGIKKMEDAIAKASAVATEKAEATE
jgi:hypothetical protein